MAQQATPEVTAIESGQERESTESETVSVETAATIDAPERVGEFEQLPVPSSETARWERVYRPEEADNYPYATVEFSISRLDRTGGVNREFRVDRAVQLYTASGESPTDLRYTKDLVASITVAQGFEVVADALAFVVGVMEGTATDASLPPELTPAQREAIRSED